MEDSIITILGYLMAVGVGLGCGSFATMPYYRLPNGEACAGKWVGEKSHCTKCNHQLRTRDLVPVFNWLLTFGKCQFCGYKISPVYFFIELSTCLLSVMAMSVYGLEQLHFYTIILGLATCMVILTATEYTYRKIPDPVLIVAVLFGLFYRCPEDFSNMGIVFANALLVAVFYAAMYRKIYKKELPNFAHPKLFAISAIWLDYGQFFAHLGLVIVLCTIIAIIGKLIKTSRPLPFGFALTSSLMINVLYPNWYQIIF